MNRLRFTREAHGYTVERLADELQLTAPTIVSWESGTVHPTVTELRDLAVLYGASVEDLAGDDTLDDRPLRSIYMVDREGIDGFWGHLGVMLPMSGAYRWYPVTASVAEAIADVVDSRGSSEPVRRSLFVETLNNRFLWINLAAMKCICLCHEAAEWPESNGELVSDHGLGQMDLEERPDHLLPGEFYQIMTEMLEGEEEGEDASASDHLIDRVQAFMAEREGDVGDDQLRRLLLDTRLWMGDGSYQWIEASAESMAEAVTEFQLDTGDGLLRLSGPDHGYLSFAVPLHQIAVVELPAARL